MNMKTWNVYCSGEIHTNWRKLLNGMVKTEGLPVQFTSPNCNHEESDAVGDILEPVVKNQYQNHPCTWVKMTRNTFSEVLNLLKSIKLEYNL